MALAETPLLPRFGRTERALHWAHAAAFFGMVATGLALYLPGLSTVVGDRPLVKAVHLAVACAWMLALLVVALAGNRRALMRSAREIDRFDADDRAWLRHGGRGAPQGRFNAGQKLHAIVQAVFALLFVVSGTLLWLGERNTTFRLSGTITLHDLTSVAAVSLVLGHLWMALVWPATRPALRGMVRGAVRVDWAEEHHAKWAAAPPSPEPRKRLGRRGALAGTAVLIAGSVGSIAVVVDAADSVTGGAAAAATSTPAAAAAVPVPATPPVPPPLTGSGLQLATRADTAMRAGRTADAVVLYRAAVRRLPHRADIRTALGAALASAGEPAAGMAQLRRALRESQSSSEARFFLGVLLTQSGQRTEGHRQLRRYLREAPAGERTAVARQILASQP